MNVNLNRLRNQDNGSMQMETSTGEKKQGAHRKTLNRNDLTLEIDVIAQKEFDARKNAMKKLGDVFSNHLKTDNEIDVRTKRMAELEDEVLNGQKELEKVMQSKEELKEAYKDNLNSDAYITELKNLEDAEDEWKARVTKAKSEKAGESAIISGIHQALLKSDPMVKASKEADKIMENANNEIVNELVNQAKDNIDEKLEEEIEETKKAKEEKAEEEKKAVGKENTSIKDTTEVIQTADSTRDKIKKEIKNLINTQQLIEEDLKGLGVDQQL
ncbi:hypothetical protein [Anaerosporobacter sp.]